MRHSLNNFTLTIRKPCQPIMNKVLIKKSIFNLISVLIYLIYNIRFHFLSQYISRYKSKAIACRSFWSSEHCLEVANKHWSYILPSTEISIDFIKINTNSYANYMILKKIYMCEEFTGYFVVQISYSFCIILKKK